MSKNSTNLTAFPPHVDLSPRAAAHWKEIMDSVPFGFFTAADLPLLRNYCRTLAMLDRAFEQIGTDGDAEDFVLQTDRGAYQANPIYSVISNMQHLIAQLATRLRLTPKSRYEESPKDKGDAEQRTVESGGGGARAGLIGLQGYIDGQRQEDSPPKSGRRTRH